MLSHLHIENMNIIKNADVFFGRGLNIITGETGAGKSAIINALNFVCGSRITHAGRKDEGQSFSVSAVISGISAENAQTINDLGYTVDEGTVLLFRELTADNRNICKVNGRPATTSILKQIGRIGVTVYNQHEGNKLLSKEKHIDYIDTFAGLAPKLKSYKELYARMKDTEKQIAQMRMDECEKERRVDLLKYQINELEEANISIGEIERLKNLKNISDNKKKIVGYINESKNILGGGEIGKGCISSLEDAAGLLDAASGYMAEIAPIEQKVKTLFYEASEILPDLSNIMDSFEYSDTECENFDERLDCLYKLSAKYGKTEEEMLAFLESAKESLSELEENDFKIRELSEKLLKTEDEVKKLAQEISDIRAQKGEILAKKMQEELQSLDMPGAKIALQHEKTELSANGCDKIQFLMSANAGQSLGPMSAIASGGEISRIALAINNIISDSSKETIVFDEIDTGVSGSAASKIGVKLKELSKSRQIICITHLAQIASFADEHFLVKKEVIDGKTCSLIAALDMSARQKEIARIIGGIKISDSALKAAQELIFTNKSC